LFLRDGNFCKTKKLNQVEAKEWRYIQTGRRDDLTKKDTFFLVAGGAAHPGADVAGHGHEAASGQDQIPVQGTIAAFFACCVFYFLFLRFTFTLLMHN
jgi:hypothetical protein